MKKMFWRNEEHYSQVYKDTKWVCTLNPFSWSTSFMPTMLCIPVIETLLKAQHKVVHVIPLKSDAIPHVKLNCHYADTIHLVRPCALHGNLWVVEEFHQLSQFIIHLLPLMKHCLLQEANQDTGPCHPSPNKSQLQALPFLCLKMRMNWWDIGFKSSIQWKNYSFTMLMAQQQTTISSWRVNIIPGVWIFSIEYCSLQ